VGRAERREADNVEQCQPIAAVILISIRAKLEKDGCRNAVTVADRLP
jgi:hypothetical protein